MTIAPSTVEPQQDGLDNGDPGTKKRSWVLPLATGIAGFLLGIGTVGGVMGASALASQAQAQAAAQKAAVAKASRDAEQKSILFNAIATCGMSDGPDSEIGDDGYTLTINSKGNDDISGISYTELSCLMDRLNTPANVRSHIEQTTSLDGRQTETWGAITMAWSYHPDRGCDAVFTVRH
jgi:hypothetical protein